jgi:hypothetical protein
MNASPVIQAGMDFPAIRKSELDFMYLFSVQPIPSTKTK